MGFRIHQRNHYPTEDFDIGEGIDYSKMGGDINPEYTPIDKVIDKMIRKNNWEERDLIVVLEGIGDGVHRHIICPLIFEECLGLQITRHFWAYAWWRFIDVEESIDIIAVVPVDEFCYEEDCYC